MARPIFQHELSDPDFSWLLSTFRENHPEYMYFEYPGVPIILFKITNEEFHRAMIPLLPSATPPALTTNTEERKEKE